MGQETTAEDSDQEPLAALRPEAAGGLRKVRMRIRATGKGKSSGARVHYLYLPSDKIIYLIFLYSKGDQATLTPEQKKQLRSIAEEFKRER